MADEIQSAEPVVTSNVSQAAELPVSEPAVESKPAEKMVPQSTVDKVVGTRVKEAYEKARRETLAEIEKQKATQAESPSMGGMQQMSQDQIRQLIQEEAWKMSNKAMAEKIANDFTQKIDAVKEKYPDFQEKYEALNLNNHPQLVLWANQLDNTGDVIYDIASNPTKVAQVLMLANSGFPDLAQKELAKLSQSIKANEQANKEPAVNAPLSQIKPSNIGTDNGARTVSDLRRMDWLRA